MSMENTGKAARLRAIADRVLAEMQASGWNPVRLKGHSKRYRVTIPGQGARTVAIKMAGKRYIGWMGWAQQKDGEWGTPLTDTDFILYTTPHEGGLGVWMFPTEAVLERLEHVQQLYDERGWGRLVSLWINIFEQPDRPTLPPCQVNFAEGKPPMWPLSFPASAADEIPAADEVKEPIEADYEPAKPPSLPLLKDFTDGQLIDELRARGLRSLNFRDDL
jgi:hypothetical protein